MFNVKNKDNEEQLEWVTLNPVCSAFKEYKMKYYHEPFLNFDHGISWRYVLGPSKSYVKGRDINDVTSYSLQLKK
jgi:hypothetical protein